MAVHHFDERSAFDHQMVEHKVSPPERAGRIRSDAGAEKPHGAENSALKNTAPLSVTPLRIWENASIRSPGLSAKSPGFRAMQAAPESRPSKTWRRSGMGGPRNSP
jgi:hypothetical protein